MMIGMSFRCLLPILISMGCFSDVVWYKYALHKHRGMEYTDDKLDFAHSHYMQFKNLALPSLVWHYEGGRVISIKAASYYSICRRFGYTSSLFSRAITFSPSGSVK